MKSTPRSGWRFSVRIASARSSGGPQTPLPTMRMAPKPSRLTSNFPPMRKRPDCAALLMTVLARVFSRSGPAGLGRHGGKNGGDVAPGLQAEDRTAIIEEIELDITASADELFLTFACAPRPRCVQPNDLGIDRDEALGDVADEGEVVVEGRIAGVAGAVEMVEEDAADPARLVTVLQEEILVAPGLEAVGVSDLGVARASPAHRGVEQDGVGVGRDAPRVEHRGQVRAAAEPHLGRAHEPHVHVDGRNVRAPRMGDHRDAGRPEARIVGRAGNLPGELGREGAEHGRAMRAHFLEQTAAQHGHAAAAARACAGVGPRPRLDREAAGRPRRIDAGKLLFEPLHRRDDPLLQAGKPFRRLSEARIGAGRIGGFGHALRTRAIIRSTWATGVSGRMPWPRLKMCALDPKPWSTRSIPSSSAAPPATRASGSRLPCSARSPGKAATAAAGSTAVSRPIAETPAMPANLASWVAAPRGKAMTGVLGALAFTFATSAATGLTHHRSNSAGGSTPAHESKTCTASAPAAIWRARYSAEASTSRSISAANRFGCR